jgi:hypothetical protein
LRANRYRKHVIPKVKLKATQQVQMEPRNGRGHRHSPYSQVA